MEHKDIDVLDFKKIYEEEPHVLLDVRTPEEYESGHLKGAANINFYNAKFEEDLDSLDKRQTYLLYCKSGSRSRQAMFLMRDLGFDEVYNLLGGITSWKENNFQTEK